jgi:Tfp pilus assembly protein PilO
VKRKLPKHFVPIAVGVGVLLLALIGWLAVVRPQNSKASALSKEIESVRAEIRENRMLARRKSTLVAVRLADIFRLSKAIPAEVDMPGILLELNRIAGETGITFESITPQTQSGTSTSYRTVSIQVVFTGNYYELADLLYRLRNLVEVHDGELSASGRLFTVDSIQFSESSEKFPKLQTTMTINAFVYGGVPPSGAPTPEGSESPPSSPASTPPASLSAPNGATAVGGTQ